MNEVILIGRLTKDPEVKYIADSNTTVARFTIAIDRPTSGEKQTDFIRIVAFGKQAENCGKYIFKGSQIAVHGRIQTGSYTDKDGKTVYTTDVVANKVKFLERSSEKQYAPEQNNATGIPSGFTPISDDDIPFA